MKHKAHMYFWITALLILTVGGLLQLISTNSTVDINVKDIYLVMATFHFSLFLAFIYFMLGVCYWFFYKQNILLNKKLTKVHTVITVLGLPAYLLLNMYIEYKSEEPLYVVLDNYQLYYKILMGIFLTVVIVQFLFPVNILISLIKRKKA
ncbi:hypothetical protein Q765_15190 [Flavobacterium rivuli WB 3.3-2 = DSM 21788]|uniref:Cytochrome C and Quinol oxidase polypeptide I n=1 Tax=Flavobacterium rivuli WB 3.3-2 = DSM 21788 TaxID=1121895 RepID=A0A0A2LZV0_9FLAO|nr:cbb3-type cytochrome c oxidase subunit I [Flavobacterium rivuli]KGO85554.1 hypothetical protein Q765_15190 [Flavobacterium rivuli WB 3.3-2 = DSM 21788]